MNDKNEFELVKNDISNLDDGEIIDESQIEECNQAEQQQEQDYAPLPLSNRPRINSISDNNEVYSRGNSKQKKLRQIFLSLYNLFIKYKTQIQFFWKHCFGLILISLAFYLFVFDIEHGCDKTIYRNTEVCIEELLVPQVPHQSRVIFITAALLYTTFILGIKKIIARYNAVCSAIVTLYLWFFKFDMRLSSVKIEFFGGAQAYFLMFMVFIVFCIHLLWIVGLKIYRRNKRIFIGIVISVVVFYFILTYLLHSTCKGWEYGLTGKIEESNKDNQLCRIQKPDICYPVLFNNWFVLGKAKCDIDMQNQLNLKKKVLKLYKKIDTKKMNEKQQEQKLNDINYLAWPLTSKFNETEKVLEVTTQQNFINQTKAYRTKEEAFESDAEAIIDLQNMELNLRIKRNETLIKERSQIYKNGGISKNIILVYIDTVSRSQAHRKLPKTMNFLKQFADKQNEQAQLYEFYRFHAIDKKTRNNSFKLQFNYMRQDIKDEVFKNFDGEQPNLMQEFINAGYITGHATNTCTSECSFRRDFIDYKPYFKEGQADHELLVYDPQYMNPDNYWSWNIGINSIYRRCLYGTDTNAHVLRYGAEFLKTYKDEQKVLYLEFTDSHEMTSELVQFIDDHLVEFFEKVKELNLFEKDTVVYLFSDHGQHILNTFIVQGQNTKDHPIKNVWEIERMLPIYQMIVSQNILKDETIAKNLEENQQKLFGMQQVRNTITQNLIKKEQSKELKDSLWSPIKSNTKCKNLGMSVEIDAEYFCMCKS